MEPSNEFLARLDSGLEAYWQQRTAGLAQFQDHNLNRPNHAVFIVVFIEFLLLATAQEVRNTVVFVETLRSDGSLKLNRVIWPNLMKFRSAFVETYHRVRDNLFGNYEGIRFPSQCEAAKSTLPCVVFGFLASITRFFRSEYAIFGLRATCAAFAGSIPAFIRTSAVFYLQYRGVWIIVVIILCLNPTTGASLNGLLVQCSGTLLGGLTAMAVWYMVDEKVAGVIVFTYLVNVFRNPCFEKG